jgi:hypothetical protein
MSGEEVRGMKGKKPLLLAVLVVALLAVGLIVPVAAFGANPNQPVNWVTGNYNTNSVYLPWELHIGFTVNVQRGTEQTDVKGFVLQEVMREPLYDADGNLNPFAFAPVVRRATEFSPKPDEAWFWMLTELEPPYFENYARFYEGTGDYAGANVAEFIIYLPVDFLADFNPGLPFTTMPHRYRIYDFGEPGRDDLVQVEGWSLSDPDDFESPWTWVPALFLGTPVPVPAGNFQVHIGESDGYWSGA